MSETKLCSTCGVVKPTAEFHACNANKDGRQRKCKACAGEYQKTISPEHKAKLNRVSRYGKDVGHTFIAQEGNCGICGISIDAGTTLLTSRPVARKAHVDHCHASGVVRGWLCLHCNALIGFAKDDPAILKRALDYLERTGVSE